MNRTTEVKLDGKEYVILPKAEYLRLRRGDTLPRTVDAIDFARGAIAADLRAARESAELTQAELAAKLRKSQTMVSQAEAGRVSVGERYVAAVLKACRLPKDWKAPAAASAGKRSGSQGCAPKPARARGAVHTRGRVVQPKTKRELKPSEIKGPTTPSEV